MSALSLFLLVLSTIVFLKVNFALIRNLRLGEKLIPFAYIILYSVSYVVNTIILYYSGGSAGNISLAFHYPVTDETFSYASLYISYNLLLFTLILSWYNKSLAKKNIGNVYPNSININHGTLKTKTMVTLFYTALLVLIVVYNAYLMDFYGINIRWTEAQEFSAAGFVLNIQTIIIPTMIFAGYLFIVDKNTIWNHFINLVFLSYILIEILIRGSKVVILHSAVIAILVYYSRINSTLPQKKSRLISFLRKLLIALIIILILFVYPYINHNFSEFNVFDYSEFINNIDLVLLSMQSIIDRLTGGNSFLDLMGIDNFMPIGFDFFSSSNLVLGNLFTQRVYAVPPGLGHTSAPGLFGFFYYTLGSFGVLVLVPIVSFIFLLLSRLIATTRYPDDLKLVLFFLLYLYWGPLNVDGQFDEHFIFNASGLKKTLGIIGTGLSFVFLFRYLHGFRK